MNKPFAGVARAGRVVGLTVAEIRDEVWLEVARQHGRVPPVAPSAPPAPVVLDLPGLLALDGMAFVEAAYHALLGRAPDDAGAACLMRGLAAGTSKVLLLGGLQRSAEARRGGRVLAGLRLRHWAHRAYRVPVLGRVARLGTRLAVAALQGRAPGLPGLSRRLAEQQRQLAALVAAQEAGQRRTRALDRQVAVALERAGALQDQFDAWQAAAAGAVLDDLAQRLAAQEAAGQALDARLAAQAGESERRLAGLEDSSLDTLSALADQAQDQSARLARLEGLLDGEAVAAQVAAGAAALRASLDGRLARAEATVAQNRHDVIDQERRIGLMLEALRRREGTLPDALQAQDERAVAQLYVDFEDRFRGTRADITARLRFYLPVLAEAQAGLPSRPVVDVGCGRGEFLALLQAEGRCARGVDSNAAMAESCRAQGLDCVAEDALAYLGRQPEGALGAVTGFHIVEHLAYPTMVRLFDAALRALAPGGVLVLETPNPANLLVASRWFYLDPTHRNPLPGEMLAMVAEARGFCRVSVVERHPMAQRFAGADPVLCGQLDRLFHGPQDYALLARKP